MGRGKSPGVADCVTELVLGFAISAVHASFSNREVGVNQPYKQPLHIPCLFTFRTEHVRIKYRKGFLLSLGFENFSIVQCRVLNGGLVGRWETAQGANPQHVYV